MTLYATIHDTLGNVLGDGPILTVSQLSVKRALDGVGSFSLSIPATDEKAWGLIVNEREIRVYRSLGKIRREILRGIVRNVTIDYVGTSSVMKVSGPDMLDALTRRIAGRYTSFDNQPISNIVSSIISKVPGWTAVVDPGLGNQTVKFGGANVFKSLMTMADHKGAHVRQGLVPNQIEFGTFGINQGVTLTNNPVMSDEVHEDTTVIQIQKLTMARNSNTIATRIRPVGAGEGVAAVTLRLSDRTTPYAINQVVEGDQVEYYLDSPNIGTYGVIERYVTFKEIVPVGNSLTSQGHAANELYDAAVSWLDKNDEPIQQFKVQGIQPQVDVRPGDKITLRFNGYVMDEDGKPWRYVELNGEYWVMGTTESISGVKSTVDLEISNIDSLVKSTQQILVDSIDAINVQNIQVKTTPFMYENCYTRYIEADDATLNPSPLPAKFIIRFSRQVVDVTSVLLHVRTFSLMNWLTLVTPQIDVGLTPTPAVGVLHTHQIPQSYIGGSFSLQEDDQYPTGLTLKINGVDYTSVLGGPWALVNAQADFDIDITDIIKDQPGGFQQTHNIWFYPSQRLGRVSLPWSYYGAQNGNNASHGFLEANFNVQGVCQAVIPS